MKNDKDKARVSDVLKAFWKAAKPQKGLVFFTLFAFGFNALLSLVTPLLYKHFFDILTAGFSLSIALPLLMRVIIAVLAINLFLFVFMRIAFVALNQLESKTMSRIRQMSFDYMIRHSHSFFANNFGGSLVQRVNRFSRSFERLYDTLVFQVVPILIAVVGSIAIVWFQEPILAKIMIGWIAGALIFNYAFSRWKVKYDVASAKADSATTAVLADNITNQNAIMLFNGFGFESKSFKATSDEQARAQSLAWDIGNIMDAVQYAFIIAAEFLIFYFGIKYWQLGMITIGTFVLLQSYILSLSQKLWDFGRLVRNIYEAFADSKEMVDILKLEHEIRDLPGATRLNVEKGAIHFKNVVFNFNETRTVLDHFDLEIAGGQKVALIGPSGAGKSTIVKTLLRMYDLTAGKILIDGQDIKHSMQGSLRENISLVPQDPILFHKSLLENIRYGRPTATDEEVFEAARLAHCDEFIDELSQKYETLVGERGVKLSGGERQRIAIARAILKNAPILVLDEATSSLDSHSESLIQDALDKLMEGKTSIVIAHRLSTIRKMDRIVVIEDGKVLEDGDHDTLLSKDGGLYKKLWNLQAGGFLKDE